MSSKRVDEIEEHIAGLRESANISEFHWSEYRGGDRRKAYQDLVQYGFQLVRKGHAELHIIIARFKGYNHKRTDGENRDTSVSRMYWQLGLHRLASYYGQDRPIHMRLDPVELRQGISLVPIVARICASQNASCMSKLVNLSIWDRSGLA